MMCSPGWAGKREWLTACEPIESSSSAPQSAHITATDCMLDAYNVNVLPFPLHQIGAKRHLIAFLTATLDRILLNDSLQRKVIVYKRLSRSGKRIRVRVATKCTIKCKIPGLVCSTQLRFLGSCVKRDIWGVVNQGVSPVPVEVTTKGR
jgi:hypothetical protein